MKQFKRKKKINIYYLIIISIVILTITIMININQRITPKFLSITTSLIEKYNDQLIVDYINLNNIYKNKLNDLINIVQNQKNEIISLDYNIDKSYEILEKVTKDLYDGKNKTNYKELTFYPYEEKEGLILYYPLGLISNNIYLNNFGPKIPVKVSFLSHILTGLQTKVSNYGINNVLVEIYLQIELENDVIIPLKEEKIKKNYNILLSSKLIMGNVPNFLGDSLKINSPILSS